MRRFVAPLLVAALVGPLPALAQADGVGRGPVPNWVSPSTPLAVPDNPGGLVFVRRQDVLVRLDAKGLNQHLGYHFRILHPNALQAGNISIAWNPAHGAPIVHMVRVHRDGQIIDVLKTTKFEVLRREDQLEAMMLNGVLTAVLKVADLRVGDELEVAFTTRVSDPTLAGQDSGFLMLGPNPAPGRYRLGLSWDKGQKPAIKLTPDLTGAAQLSEDGLELKFDNPALLVPPKDAPSRYQWQRIVEYSDFADWKSISRHFAPLYVRAAKLADGSALAREADRIAAAHADPMERARAALKLVQQDVRYIYVGLDSGNLTPATAEETWQRRYGDCKGKTAMLLALLARLGSRRRRCSPTTTAATTVSTPVCPARACLTMSWSGHGSAMAFTGWTEPCRRPPRRPPRRYCPIVGCFRSARKAAGSRRGRGRRHRSRMRPSWSILTRVLDSMRLPVSPRRRSCAASRACSSRSSCPG
ncbi:DUF3857 domain-containing protein [Sphingomonas sp. J315]|uniref:DUF3857 domain-containing protein n=1 Tax=Sphingomonas sp. J315 TaxID=2898433 RepID=UPI0021AD9419|nr:DUF3857 domain-containing protein [Sphingomonas sp. J315]UUX98072.1 DUF3857 domain-containing protein [Sphingomonas sp. J315]